jgi:hypothetical protein
VFRERAAGHFEYALDAYVVPDLHLNQCATSSVVLVDMSMPVLDGGWRTSLALCS